MQTSALIHIRDPLHGAIPISTKERALIDCPIFQRLRNVRQLGFADQAFPGATHTRYGHSLGAMHLATKMFENIFQTIDLPEEVKCRFKQVVRLAMLFHDIGHAPLSHTTEMAMPKVSQLGLPETLVLGSPNRQATHEDYTLKILTASELSLQLEKHFSDEGISGDLLANLFLPQNEASFTHNGIDYTPVMRQIISSECDADRMDYLERDSLYCGVNYGKIDTGWLINNLVGIEKDSKVYLGIRNRAIFSFEDFLLSRYHMFVSVYHHYTPAIFEKLLKNYFKETADEFRIPSDLDDFVQTDDITLWHTLRQSNSPWAKRIVERKPYFLLLEEDAMYPTSHAFRFKGLVELLKQNKIDFIQSRSKSALSKYFGKPSENIYVDLSRGKTENLEDYTPLFKRYKKASRRARVYVEPRSMRQAQGLLKKLGSKNV